MFDEFVRLLEEYEWRKSQGETGIFMDELIRYEEGLSQMGREDIWEDVRETRKAWFSTDNEEQLKLVESQLDSIVEKVKNIIGVK